MGDSCNNLTLDAVVMKNIPNSLKGILNGIFQFSGFLGMLVYSKTAGYLFDYYGPEKPLEVMMSMDIGFGVICCILALTGIFAKEPKMST